MDLYGTKQIAEKLEMSVKTIRAYISREYFPVVIKYSKCYVSKETLENLLFLKSRGFPLSSYVETLEKPHKDGYNPERMSLEDYKSKGWSPRWYRGQTYRTSGMGDPSQTDMFEEATYVKPKYLQLHGSENDFDVLPTMYLREKEDMSAEELRQVVNDILLELKDYEKELVKKDKGYTGRTIQVEKSGTGELVRELQKTIAEQERDIHKLDKRIQELQKRMENLKKSK